jgi:type I restriction enzyme M protein
VKDRETLQRRSLFGGEAKSLPYLLAQMNLLLHGLEYPQIDPGNSLRFKLNEIGDKERVNIILTNPPFGGAEEKGIQDNFPNDMQTSETALLFLQLIIRKLKRSGGRCAVVVHDGFLSNLGVASRAKQHLLAECNLHTVVRLPFGVFEPYTPIRTNLLFFEKGQPTAGVWFYEVTIADGRKKYTKTKPLRREDFIGCREWWTNRQEGPHSWYVPISEIEGKAFGLDFRNPSEVDESLPEEPVAIISRMKQSLQAMAKGVQQLEELLGIRNDA